jgi:site-specific recombinase XerD
MTSIIPKDDNSLSTDVLHDWKKAAASWLDNFSSEDTRRAYRQAWSGFLDFAGTPPDKVSQDEVISYRRHLETSTSPKTGEPYTQATINLRLSALSSFFEWAKGRGLRSDNPADGVKRKAVNPYGKATWLRSEDGEDYRLLESIDTSTTRGIRDRAIMLLFLTLALRVSSVAGLTVGSLRRQGKTTFLTYTQKGGKTREVGLPEPTAEAINAYLDTRTGLTDSSPLFTASEAGRKAAGRLGHEAEEETPLTTRAIAALVDSYCNKALGKGHGIHPHSLRHTAAVNASRDHTIAEVSDLLGHASLQVTTIYLHATGKATDKVAADLGRRYSKQIQSFKGE